MSAQFLLGIFDSVYVIALTAWVGSILFFSFGVAPIIFTVLGSEHGGEFVRASFRLTMPGERSRGRSPCRPSWRCRSVIRNTAGEPSRSNRWRSWPAR